MKFWVHVTNTTFKILDFHPLLVSLTQIVLPSVMIHFWFLSARWSNWLLPKAWLVTNVLRSMKIICLHNQEKKILKQTEHKSKNCSSTCISLMPLEKEREQCEKIGYFAEITFIFVRNLGSGIAVSIWPLLKFNSACWVECRAGWFLLWIPLF